MPLVTCTTCRPQADDERTKVAAISKRTLCNIFSTILPFACQVDRCFNVLVTELVETCAKAARRLEYMRLPVEQELIRGEAGTNVLKIQPHRPIRERLVRYLNENGHGTHSPFPNF